MKVSLAIVQNRARKPLVAPSSASPSACGKEPGRPRPIDPKCEAPL